jgi:uncharacterized membrane protein
MRERPQGWRVLLSHHASQDLHHCYRLGVTPEGLHVCARCLGLYPVLLATIGFEVGLWRLEFDLRWLLAFSLVTPAVIDWSRSMLFAARGSNVWRTVTGGLAGVGLGIAFGDYFRDSGCAYFWTLMGGLALVIALVWWAWPGRSLRP